MKIYIASSWKNKHGVEMLTALLRNDSHNVVSRYIPSVLYFSENPADKSKCGFCKGLTKNEPVK